MDNILAKYQTPTVEEAAEDMRKLIKQIGFSEHLTVIPTDELDELTKPKQGPEVSKEHRIGKLLLELETLLTPTKYCSLNLTYSSTSEHWLLRDNVQGHKNAHFKNRDVIQVLEQGCKFVREHRVPYDGSQKYKFKVPKED